MGLKAGKIYQCFQSIQITSQILWADEKLCLISICYIFYAHSQSWYKFVYSLEGWKKD